MKAHEVNFDGLVGPTHSYAGLSSGNVASMSNRGDVSHPRAAALQGLAKMKALADLGLRQAVLPPHERPSLSALRSLGYAGSDAVILRRVARENPALLASCSSASNMWVANAATVTPSIDAPDGRVHFTPANLVSKFHRSLEPGQTGRTLRAIFRDETRFVVHPPIPGAQSMGDEGAANHTRLAPSHGARGLHLFAYGHEALAAAGARPREPRKFASRQALEASLAVARQHGLRPQSAVFTQQDPAAIDAGVFHNDVISVGNENLLVYHERAFVDADRAVADIARRFSRLQRGAELVVIRVPARRVSLRDAVRTYLFNSQIVTVSSGRMLLIAPAECEAAPRVRTYVEDIIGRGDTPLTDVRYFDLKESMRNGGGPACLRLRVVLTPAELAALPRGIFLDDTTYPALVAWVNKWYPERLKAADLADPQLLESNRRALDELTRLLGLGNIYPCQGAEGRTWPV